MNLNLVAAADQATPALLEAVSNGNTTRTLFMHTLKQQRNALSDADWLLLLITLLAMTASPATALRARISPASTVLPAAPAPCQGARQ